MTPELILNAYASGYFPMARSRHDPELYWFDPDPRAILPLDEGFHIPRSLKKIMKKQPFTLTLNRDFAGVIRACADTRDESWINDTLIDLYTEIHRMGHAHSLEVWSNNLRSSAAQALRPQGACLRPSAVGAESFTRYRGTKSEPAGRALQCATCPPKPWRRRKRLGPSHGSESRTPEELGRKPATTSPVEGRSLRGAKAARPERKLIGGIYGLALGSAFFGESMFSRAPNASKVALVTLHRTLTAAGYTLFDVQYVNDHLQQFGVREIPREDYLRQLDAALQRTSAPLHLVL